MAQMNIVLPAMGEGVIEATVNKWLVSEGARFKEYDPLVEVSTDKVDSEVPAPADGTLVSIITAEGSDIKVGDILAVMEDHKEQAPETSAEVKKEVDRIRETIDEIKKSEDIVEKTSHGLKSRTPAGKFLSPLVRSIVTREGVRYEDLDKINGTGMDGRITKDDLFIMLRKKEKEKEKEKEEQKNHKRSGGASEKKMDYPNMPDDEVIPMDRIRKKIADHMVMSKKISPHVTSFIDADVTGLVTWRENNKDKFLQEEGQKLTLTPLFIDAAARALHEFPMVNISVEDDNIIRRKNINIGMATALPDGNLIVPVIKNANEKNLTGIARSVNDLATRARNNKLKPEEITGGTFTVTNFGSYNNLAGTPIINQPQAAILGTGAVRKVPAVVETHEGDMIAIRRIMILSLSYDHRAIDGALAGKFLQKVKEILENYSPVLP